MPLPDTRPQAVVWDLDGTLVDSAPDLRAALNEVLGRQALPPLRLDEVRSRVGGGVAQLVALGFQAAGRALEPDELAARVAEYVAAYHRKATRWSRPYPGVRDVLRRCRATGIPQGICTNKPSGLARQVLAELGLAELIDCVVGGDSTTELKPHPLPLRTCLAALGAGPQRSWMVGDSAADVAAARALGMPVAVVSWGYARGHPEALGADRVIEGPDQLARLVAPAVDNARASGECMSPG